MHDSASSRARVLMLASVVLFVVNTLIVRQLGTSYAVSSWASSTARFIIGAGLVALPFLPGGRANFRAVCRNPLLIARGVLGGFGVYVYYVNIEQLGPGRATFLNVTYIAMGAVLASIFLRERLRPPVIFALMLGLTGVGLLTGVTLDVWSLSRADAFALFGALLAAIVIVLIRKLHETERTPTIFAAQCAWGLVLCAGPAALETRAPELIAIVLLVLSGLLAAFGQLAMTAGYKSLPVAEGSLYQALLPLGTALAGVLFLGEQYAPREAIGGILIVASCVLAGRSRPRLTAELPAVGAGPMR